MLGGTITSELTLVAKVARAEFNSAMLPADLARRGVQSKALAYPYRDDALRVWKAISDYVGEGRGGGASGRSGMGMTA